MELLMTGEAISAEEAWRLGMVNHVVDDGVVLDRARQLALKIASMPPVQIGMIRRLVRQAERVDLRTHFDVVSSHFGVVSALEDCAEAAQAFSEKRPGVFIGK
jgi:enoyl-CoA hydratase/carnithine racemase